jgi:hypothetical protein
MQLTGLAAGVLLDGEQGGHALAVLVLPAHGVAGPLGRDHHHIHIGGGLNQAEADVEAVGEAQHLAGAQMGSNLLLIHRLLGLVGEEHHDPVGLAAGVGHAQHLQAIGPGFLGRAAALVEAHNHVDAAVLEVEGMGMALGAVADDRHGLAAQQGEVGVGVVEELGHPGVGAVPG